MVHYAHTLFHLASWLKVFMHQLCQLLSMSVQMLIQRKKLTSNMGLCASISECLHANLGLPGVIGYANIMH